MALLDLLGFSTGEVERMVLVLSRLSGLALSAPFFSRSVGSMRFRAVFFMAMTVVVYPLVPPWAHEGKGLVGLMFMAVIAEVMVGAVFGLMVHFALVSTQLAGNIMGFQMGLSMAQVMDPTSGMQEGVLSNLLYMAALMLFLIMDGHHLLLEGIVRSFRSIPLGAGLPSAETLLEAVVEAVSKLFVLGIMISAPIIAATMLLYLGMGLINRASPQIQVFFLSMPLAQLMGLMIMGVTLAVFAEVFVREMETFVTLAYRVVGL
ncbi:MAG: flagellar biosynthetic protein FliR [Magnetococcales bacterium]|nr:flagellar biosynthetic protein FliR [Magnetococcales bacterium]